jgi:hypothetical protein
MQARAAKTHREGGKKKKARFREAGFSGFLFSHLHDCAGFTTEFWLPDLDSNQGPAD